MVFWGQIDVFVPVAQTVNCGIYWVFLKVCRNAIRPTSRTTLCNIPITLRIHSPCHISLAVQQGFVMKQTVAVPNFMWLLSLTESQELTQFLCLKYLKFNIKQQQVQQPSQIWPYHDLQRFFKQQNYSCFMFYTYYYTYTYMYVYVSCCEQFIYKFQGILDSLTHFSVQENTNFWLREIY
jgi:hypothetical protein